MLTTRSRTPSRKYYSKGLVLSSVHISLIREITTYLLNQINPQVTKEGVEVINFISTATSGEDVLKYIIMYENMNEDLSDFLIMTTTALYS